MQPDWVQHAERTEVVLFVVTAGSSTDVSEDWEKDFDLDMTEEEVQMALSKIESSGDVKCLFNTLLLSRTQVKKFNEQPTLG